MRKKRVVVMGGGTGTFTVLSGLKKYHCDLAAIVAMADNGGSTGILRDELGVLPPGDVRQCLVALSAEDGAFRSLMSYRFQAGTLRGHSFGNLLLSALEKVTGNFGDAVETASRILRVHGLVIPATLQKTNLVLHNNGRVVRGQSAVHNTRINGRSPRMTLSPHARANPKALAALGTTDAIVIGPGDFYSSVMPNLLVDGIPDAIRKSRAKKIFVCNLMSRDTHHKNFSVANYTHAIETLLGGPVDVVLYNNTRPTPRLVAKYARNKERITRFDELPEKHLCVGGDFIDRTPITRKRGDILKRSLVRHNPTKLARAIARIIGIRRS